MSAHPRLIALLSTYNEADCLADAIEFLIREGAEVYIIDNHSTDQSYEIAQSFLGRGVIGCEQFPGMDSPLSKDIFPLAHILHRKEQLVQSLEGDWFLNCDADEFRSSPWQNVSLIDAIAHIDTEGYDAVNFEVLDFHFTERDDPNITSCLERQSYYATRPWFQNHQVKLFKKSVLDLPNQQSQISDFVQSGGHLVKAQGLKIYPMRFLLRHFPRRSETQLAQKFGPSRLQRLSPAELRDGWHQHLVLQSQQAWQTPSTELTPWLSLEYWQEAHQNKYADEAAIVDLGILDPDTLQINLDYAIHFAKRSGEPFQSKELLECFQGWMQCLVDKPLPSQIPPHPQHYPFWLKILQASLSLSQQILPMQKIHKTLQRPELQGLKL